MELEEEKHKLSKYQQQKAAIYKWQAKNKDAYRLKQHLYNMKRYSEKREEIIEKVRAHQKKKQEETGNRRKRGRPRLYEIIISVEEEI